MWLVYLSPGRLKRDVVVYVPRKVRLRRTGRSAAADRQRQLRHQAQWPYTPSGVQGAPHPARPEKTDGTAMAERAMGPAPHPGRGMRQSEEFKNS
ncbi:TPA: hypothetical protein JZG04_004490 [Escherichia coli]|nr:hypothetical protein [Escherichia coli]